VTKAQERLNGGRTGGLLLSLRSSKSFLAARYSLKSFVTYAESSSVAASGQLGGSMGRMVVDDMISYFGLSRPPLVYNENLPNCSSMKLMIERLGVKTVKFES
jgi:hypothetical protein